MHFTTHVIRLLAVPAILAGQTTIDLKTQTKHPDLSGQPATRPVQVGTSLPSNCSGGQLYFKLDAEGGKNLYGCTTAGTWLLQSGGIDQINVLPAANTVPKSGPDGKLSQGWIDFAGYQTALGYTPLNPANSLSDVTNPEAARTNLGLAEAATKPVAGAGDHVATQSGSFAANAVPSSDATGTLVDSGCSAANGGLTCGPSLPSRIGVRQGPAPTDAVVNGVPNDAVLYVDETDGILKSRKSDGTVVFLSSRPTITSFVNAVHDHSATSGGGQLGAGSIAAGSRSGTGSKLATTSGVLPNGNCVKIDANGNFVDSGSTCGSSFPYTPLNPANNLSDLASVPTARSNLGLGAAATRGIQGNGAGVLAFSGTTPPADSIAVYDANGNATGNTYNCRITTTGLQCGGTQSSVLVLPELTASGHGTDSRIYGASSQTTSACVVWPTGSPTSGQVAADSGTTATMTDGKICRVLAWQNPPSPAGATGAMQKNGGSGGFAAATAGTDFVAPGAATTYTAGAKQTFQPSTTIAGENIACAPLPSTPAAGDLACDSADSNRAKQYNGTAWVTLGASGGSGDVSSNTSTSVDGEAAVFNDGGGKSIRRATGTGAAKLTAGVLSTVAGTATDCVRADGSTGACGAILADCSDPSVSCVYEPFMPRTSQIGTFGWATISGTAAIASPEAGHWGIYSVATGSTVNSTAGIDLSGGNLAPVATLSSETNWTVYWKFKTPAAITEWQVYVGFEYAAVSSAFPATAGAWARYGNSTGCTNNLSDSTWVFETNASGVSTTSDSGHGIAAATWYWVRLRSTTAGTILFSLKADGESWSVERTISTNLYTGIQTPFLKQITCNTTAKTLKVDEFRLTKTGLN